MSKPVIQVENLSKAYQIGQIGTGTLSRDIERFWTTKILGKEDPFLSIGETNDRSIKGESNIVWSLKDINFSINQGDAVGIIGKNGAGKSTLLKLLSRVTAPTTGEIKVKGRIASLLEVGTGFHPELSGRENIYLNGAILGMRRQEIARKFDEIVDFAGVERYIDTPVKRYSSGMYVRLAFAVAAHLESEILIVDEVLAVGDAEFQKKCLGKMNDVSKGEGRTVLFVSHNMVSVQNLCKKGILLNKGLLEMQGSAADVINKYFVQSHSNQELIEKDKRAGNGIIRVNNIVVSGNSYKIRPVMGGSVKIEFILDNPQQLKSDNVVLDVDIEDFRGNKIMWISTYLDEDKESTCLNKVTIIIDRLMVKNGVYFVSFDLSVNKTLSDYLEHAITFDVSELDFFKNAKQIPKNKSSVLTNFKIIYE